MNRIDEIKEQICKLQSEMKQIQSECCHPLSSMTGKADSNTGNYDPDNDRYWYNFTCGLCEKHWTEDQNKSDYYLDGNQVKKRRTRQ